MLLFIGLPLGVSKGGSVIRVHEIGRWVRGVGSSEDRCRVGSGVGGNQGSGVVGYLGSSVRHSHRGGNDWGLSDQLLGQNRCSGSGSTVQSRLNSLYIINYPPRVLFRVIYRLSVQFVDLVLNLAGCVDGRADVVGRFDVRFDGRAVDVASADCRERWGDAHGVGGCQQTGWYGRGAGED